MHEYMQAGIHIYVGTPYIVKYMEKMTGRWIKRYEISERDKTEKEIHKREKHI